MDYSVNADDREKLVATLRQFQVDRAERHETRRADEAREAAELLERGADMAYFERIIYVVGECDRWSVWSGTRDAVLAELSDAAIGWDHQGKPELTSQATDAMVRVRDGADMARVGHWLYLVRVEG